MIYQPVKFRLNRACLASNMFVFKVANMLLPWRLYTRNVVAILWKILCRQNCNDISLHEHLDDCKCPRETVC